MPEDIHPDHKTKSHSNFESKNNFNDDASPNADRNSIHSFADLDKRMHSIETLLEDRASLDKRVHTNEVLLKDRTKMFGILIVALAGWGIFEPIIATPPITKAEFLDFRNSTLEPLKTYSNSISKLVTLDIQNEIEDVINSGLALSGFTTDTGPAVDQVVDRFNRSRDLLVTSEEFHETELLIKAIVSLKESDFPAAEVTLRELHGIRDKSDKLKVLTHSLLGTTMLLQQTRGVRDPAAQELFEYAITLGKESNESVLAYTGLGACLLYQANEFAKTSDYPLAVDNFSRVIDLFAYTTNIDSSPRTFYKYNNNLGYLYTVMLDWFLNTKIDDEELLSIAQLKRAGFNDVQDLVDYIEQLLNIAEKSPLRTPAIFESQAEFYSVKAKFQDLYRLDSSKSHDIAREKLIASINHGLYDNATFESSWNSIQNDTLLIHCLDHNDTRQFLRDKLLKRLNFNKKARPDA